MTMSATKKAATTRAARKKKTVKRRAPNAAETRLKKLIAREVAPLKREIEALRADLDSIEDAAAIGVIDNASDEERFPAALAKALVAGEHPVRVFRNHRGMTQEQLAASAGTSSAYISQIENRDRDAGKKLLPRLAAALNVDIVDLM